MIKRERGMIFSVCRSGLFSNFTTSQYFIFLNSTGNNKKRFINLLKLLFSVAWFLVEGMKR
jgi:hypothetical protein